MKLSKRQSAMIDEMVLSEARSVLKSRDERYRILGESRRNELLFEVGPDATNVDSSILEEIVEGDEFENVCYNVTADFLSSFRVNALKLIVKAVNQHGMTPVKMTYPELHDLLVDFSDDLVDAEKEFTTDVMDALSKYAKSLATATAAAAVAETAAEYGEDESFEDDEKDQDLYRAKAAREGF
jgi:hypothetical protein